MKKVMAVIIMSIEASILCSNSINAISSALTSLLASQCDECMHAITRIEHVHVHVDTYSSFVLFALFAKCAVGENRQMMNLQSG